MMLSYFVARMNFIKGQVLIILTLNSVWLRMSRRLTFKFPREIFSSEMQHVKKKGVL